MRENQIGVALAFFVLEMQLTLFEGHTWLPSS